jgi:hypothetical protein
VALVKSREHTGKRAPIPRWYSIRDREGDENQENQDEEGRTRSSSAFLGTDFTDLTPQTSWWWWWWWWWWLLDIGMWNLGPQVTAAVKLQTCIREMFGSNLTRDTAYSDSGFSWRMSSSGMWRCVDYGLTAVSEERIASIFKVEKSSSVEPASAGGCRLSHQSETPTQSAVTCWRWFHGGVFFYPEDGGDTFIRNGG